MSDKDLVRVESEGDVSPWPSQFPSTPGVNPETLKSVKRIEAAETQLCYPSSWNPGAVMLQQACPPAREQAAGWHIKREGQLRGVLCRDQKEVSRAAPLLAGPWDCSSLSLCPFNLNYLLEDHCFKHVRWWCEKLVCEVASVREEILGCVLGKNSLCDESIQKSEGLNIPF